MVQLVHRTGPFAMRRSRRDDLCGAVSIRNSLPPRSLAEVAAPGAPGAGSRPARGLLGRLPDIRRTVTASTAPVAASLAHCTPPACEVRRPAPPSPTRPAEKTTQPEPVRQRVAEDGLTAEGSPVSSREDRCVASPPTVPTARDFGDDREWLATKAHTQALLSAGKHVEAYLALSAALVAHGEDRGRATLLRARRAACSYALMNYRECISDCQFALSMGSANDGGVGGDERPWSTQPLSSSSPSPSRSSEGEQTGWSTVEAVRVGARAHVMREEYAAADRLYRLLLDRPAAAGASSEGWPPLSAVDRASLTRERASLTSAELFRSHIAREEWTAALHALDAARPLVDETPLRTLEAVARLESGDVDGAREVLLPYLPTLAPPPPPPPRRSPARPRGDDSAWEEQQLRCNADAHYLLATALLAKVSAYSGRAYVNIAAVLLQRCLAVNATYAPAIALGTYLVELEDAFAAAEACVRTSDFTSGIHALTDALALDPSNRRMCAALLQLRAELHLAAGRPRFAVEDCTLSIAQDSRAAVAGRAYALRMRANGAMHRHAEEAADAEAARRLCPGLVEAAEEAEAEACAAAGGGRAHGPVPPLGGVPRGDGIPRTRARPFPSISAGRSTPSAPRAQPNSTGQRAVTLYDLLEVSPRASLVDIRQSFKRLTLQYHPDRIVGAPEESQMRALEMFKRINNAHAILSDEARRRAYDATLL